MNAVEFKPEHLRMIEAAGGREVFGPYPFAPGHAERCAESVAWTCFDGDRILGCGGIFPEHETCGTAWTLMLPITARHMTSITRMVLRVLDSSSMTRIQAHASPTFRPAMRWLVMLGFKYEGTLRKFTPMGSDVLLFARVR